MAKKEKLQISFVHPDLGIGGAERLVVDAAVALKRRGHSITIYTSYFDPERSFPEIGQEGIPVICKGSFLPRHLLGKGHIVFAILKSWFLALYILFLSFATPKKTDVFIVDQISSSIPILRVTGTKILFYCHFPDKLLTKRESLAKKVYRLPLDMLEEITTKMSDAIVVNSKFTASVFSAAFQFIPMIPSVLYPGIALESYDKRIDVKNASIVPLVEFAKNNHILVSINRFERKKNIVLALESFSLLAKSCPKEFPNLRLVVAGGYDARVNENVEYLRELEEKADQLKLLYHVWKAEVPIPENSHILFLPSFSNEQRTFLLEKSLCLLYTPSEEHFGIVPLEAMYSRLPVIACNSGGPKETVIHGNNGYLCEPTPASFSSAVQQLLQNPSKKESFGVNGRLHVADRFSVKIFGDRLEDIVFQTKNSFNLDAIITFYAAVVLFGSLLPLMALTLVMCLHVTFVN